jgi:hypothetical protein
MGYFILNRGTRSMPYVLCARCVSQAVPVPERRRSDDSRNDRNCKRSAVMRRVCMHGRRRKWEWE